jgi:hypothetical protein
VEVDPNGNGTKYLNLAEFLPGQESMKAYAKGIELLTIQKQALISAVIISIVNKCREKH